MAIPSQSMPTDSAAAKRKLLKLPHPYLTEYALERRQISPSDDSHSASAAVSLHRVVPSQSTAGAEPVPVSLHNANLHFTSISTLKSSELPPDSDNSPWARARRSPECVFIWDLKGTNASCDEDRPTLAQIWLLVYMAFTIRPDMEQFRLELRGDGGALVGRQMKDVGLAVDIPAKTTADDIGKVEDSRALVLRGAFWQGAGSPLGPRPIWLPESSPASLPEGTPLASYPTTPLQYAMSHIPIDATTTHLARHPLRPAKPHPGSVIYSRYIPHLSEVFSMIVVDPNNLTHLHLFHTWQNDPRVSQGWNESGTLEHHKSYLLSLHNNPAQLPVLACFDDVPFAYFEIYWAKEDRLGAYFNAGDYDRGRHSLVGDVAYRGPHRVSAWWSSLMHFMFLDDTRTASVVGEPKEGNTIVIAYDIMHGFGVEEFVDLGHKRSVLVRCSRERFFEICPLGGDGEKVVAGLRIGLVPKL